VKRTPETPAPENAGALKAIPPVICYPVDTLPAPDMEMFRQARRSLTKIDEVLIPPRDARCFKVPCGHFFRIYSQDGPQVGDLNIWAQKNLEEKFYSGKTRALHGSHVSTGDQLWSSFPFLRPMATITHDTLDWYGWDAHGGSVHDVIGTRCDPYTAKLLQGHDYHNCCHSNLVRALSFHTGRPINEIEPLVHDVMNVFMCTGFTPDTHQYFMKASPVRPGDFIEFFAEIDLLGGLSACPGGDCSAAHSSDDQACYPLRVEVFKPEMDLSERPEPVPSTYVGGHGTKQSA